MNHDSAQRAVTALVAELGDQVFTSGSLLEEVRSDKSGWTTNEFPLAVVEAESVQDVQTVLRTASQHRVPVVPRGAGTGLAGGAVGTAGTIVLSTMKMNRILELNYEDELAVVEPGVINQHLSDATASAGYTYSPDPASKAISSIGGNIATNAGGLLCAKYGVTREAVLGLTVVLPDGRLLKTGRRSIKGVTGYDLTALFTGSEGTLGVIVEATVRLRPIPPGDVITIGAFFPNVTAAASACAAVTASRARPAILELMDPLMLKAIDVHNQTDLCARGNTYVLAQTDGAASHAEAEGIAATLRAAGGDVEVSADPAHGERLLAIRRSGHAALEAAGEVLIEDVCVPRSQLPAMFRAIEQISAKYDVPIPVVAHAGDGNLHPNFVLPHGTGEVPERIWDAASEMFREAVSLGGTLTGEHGVGVLKRRWLQDELGELSYSLQAQIKAVFDPLGIMNPGKVFN